MCTGRTAEWKKAIVHFGNKRKEWLADRNKPTPRINKHSVDHRAISIFRAVRLFSFSLPVPFSPPISRIAIPRPTKPRYLVSPWRLILCGSPNDKAVERKTRKERDALLLHPTLRGSFRRSVDLGAIQKSSFPPDLYSSVRKCRFSFLLEFLLTFFRPGCASHGVLNLRLLRIIWHDCRRIRLQIEKRTLFWKVDYGFICVKNSFLISKFFVRFF